jgi:predicted nucleic acid-binding protein
MRLGTDMAVFLDSNIVLYAFGDDAGKGATARQLLGAAAPSPLISTQVLNECSHVMRRKLKWPADRVAAELEVLLQLVEVAPVSVTHIRAAWILAARYGYSHYDSLIVATALAAGCDTLYTEDMQAGQLIDQRLRLVNPFLRQADA